MINCAFLQKARASFITKTYKKRLGYDCTVKNTSETGHEIIIFSKACKILTIMHNWVQIFVLPC